MLTALKVLLSAEQVFAPVEDEISVLKEIRDMLKEKEEAKE